MIGWRARVHQQCDPALSVTFRTNRGNSGTRRSPGGMARAIAARAVEGGNAVEVIGRDQAKAEDLAAALGGGATAGTFAAAPAGDIVILAVPYASAAPVLAQYGDALAARSSSISRTP